jgi:ligand-binding sensor domain-containing protein
MIKNGCQHILFFFFLQFSFAQNAAVWKGYFSYNNIKDLSQSSTVISAASENALFSKNIITNNIKTTNSINGLSGETITAIYYSSIENKTLLGYENGLIMVINEVDGSMLKIVDITTKQLPANLKKINHFMEYGGIVYVSCDFGIVQFNLKTALFKDTYFIGNNGTEISVSQTAVFNGFIYASTSDGVRKADFSDKNLIDFKKWTQVTTGSWMSVEAFQTELIAINISGNVHRYNPITNSFTSFNQLLESAVDLRTSGDYLIITTSKAVYIYSKQMTLVRKIGSDQIKKDFLNFTCATTIADKIYIGTKEDGIYSSTISVVSAFENTVPSGPSRNNVFAVQAATKSLWAVYGDYDLFYNPFPLDSYGLSKYDEKGWLNISNEHVFNAKSLVRIAVNPKNENEVYVGSSYSGLLKIVNDKPTVLYNQKNSGLQEISFIPNYFNDVRVNGAVFDKSGNLWVNNSLVNEGIKVLNTDGTWQRFSTKSIISNPLDTTLGKMSIDQNGTKWIATNNSGIIGFNEKGNVYKKITVGIDTGNLPTEDARVVALDNNNQLWIGTAKGLRVLSNVNSFLTDTKLATRPIIILEDNLAQELMYEQFITDIAVDGANNKWIGTADSGIFLVSPNGQETKYHFTINNSPLPSNTINDIDINSITGEVFIATNKGMVSFKGTATAAKEDLSNVYVYPNPVRPEYEGTVKIAGLIDKATIKITDIEGNLVHETTSEGGAIEWDTTAFGKYKVASGVYMIFISAQDGIETKIKKVMIIR